MELSQGESRKGKGTGMGPLWGEKACWTMALGANTRASPALLTLLDSRERQGKKLQESLSPVPGFLLLLLLGWDMILSCAKIIYTD